MKKTLTPKSKFKPSEVVLTTQYPHRTKKWKLMQRIFNIPATWAAHPANTTFAPHNGVNLLESTLLKLNGVKPKVDFTTCSTVDLIRTVKQTGDTNAVKEYIKRFKKYPTFAKKS